MSHPDGLPDLFVDRSLGRIAVPRLLRREGLRLITLAERYGVPQDELVADETWIADAGGLGEAVLMKDERVARNPAERNAVLTHSVRCFCLARQDLTGPVMAQLYISYLSEITRATATVAEGAIWVVSQRGLRRLQL